MDLNVLAQRIAEKEGKKVAVNIAQIKEVLRIALQLLAKEPAEEVLGLLKRSR